MEKEKLAIILLVICLLSLITIGLMMIPDSQKPAEKSVLQDVVDPIVYNNISSNVTISYYGGGSSGILYYNVSSYGHENFTAGGGGAGEIVHINTTH